MPTTRLELKEADEESTAWALVYAGPETCAKLCGLTPGARYLLRASASNSAGRGPCSAAARLTTPLLPPHAPSDVTLTCSTDGRLHAAWKPPADAVGRAAVASYEVELTDGRGGGLMSKQLLTVPFKPCSLVVPPSRTTSCSHWQLRVRAIGADGAGAGGWSAQACFDAPRAAPPAASSAPAPVADGPPVASGVVLVKRPSRRSTTMLSKHVVQLLTSWALCLALCGTGLAVLYATILA